MKKINWIIDKYLFDEYEERLSTAIKDSGANVFFYDDICGLSFREWVSNKFTQDDIVIFHGSLQHGKQLTYLPIYPGVFMTIDNYECYKYYGYYGENLLNSNYMMMGLNDVVRNKSNIVKFISNKQYPIGEDLDKRVFIRPSNGYKTFAGQLITIAKLEQDINILMQSYGGVDPETLVLLSNVQEIKEEYRFIVIGGNVITGSLYMDEENIGTHKAHYDKPVNGGSAFDFAVKISKIHTPDKAYTIDVCKTNNGEYKLLEINSFNCASMYGADYGKVVEATNELAIKEYNDLFNI